MTKMRPVSILAALSGQELGEFLPCPLIEHMHALADPFVHLATDQLTPAAFHQLISERNPEILLTCWKTPPLPPQLPRRLRYVCHLSGSIKKIITREHLERGLIVSN